MIFVAAVLKQKISIHNCDPAQMMQVMSVAPLIFATYRTAFDALKQLSVDLNSEAKKKFRISIKSFNDFYFVWRYSN